jgi:hypothetical protein
MNAKYRKFKDVSLMSPEEVKLFKETQFDFNEMVFGGFVICDPVIYSEVPANCKLETIPISFRNGNYRADAIVDGYMDENEEVYVSESEMDACILIKWPL